MNYDDLEPIKMKMRFKLGMAIIAIIFLVCLGLGVMYFFYDHFIVEAKVDVTGNLSINYNDGNIFKSGKLEKLSFSITNNSENNVVYTISISSINGEGTYTLNDSEKKEITNGDILEDVTIKAGERINYVFSIEGEDIYGVLKVKENEVTSLTFSELILANSVLKDEPLTDLGTIATTDEGLIKCEDDLGECYYFRGNVTNNYVDFAGLTWRIVKINGDKSVKLVLNTNLDTLSSYYYKDEERSFEYVDSAIKVSVDSFYDLKIKEYDNYLSTIDFCNDIGEDEKGNYLAYNRILTDKIYSHKCLNTKYHGKIGLLSVDEVIYAGASTTEKNESFYLYNAENGSEEMYIASSAKKTSSYYYPFVMSKNGTIAINVYGLLNRAVRPVINLSGNTIFTGDGSLDNPYKIKE